MITLKLAFFPIWMIIFWTESVLMWTRMKEMKRTWQLTQAEDNADKSENNNQTDNQETEVSRNNSLDRRVKAPINWEEYNQRPSQNTY